MLRLLTDMPPQKIMNDFLDFENVSLLVTDLIILIPVVILLTIMFSKKFDNLMNIKNERQQGEINN